MATGSDPVAPSPPNETPASTTTSSGLGRQLLALAIPAASTSLLETLVFLADRVMLGRYSRDALASMQVQGPVVWSLFSVFMALCVGGVSVVARNVGAERPERAKAASRSVLRLACFSGVSVAVAGWLLTPQITAAIGPASPTIQALCVSYLRAALLGFPGLFVATGASMVLGASGDTKTPLRAAVVSNVLNVGLNQLLIFGYEPFGVPSLGVRGAAIASSVAFSVQALLISKSLLEVDCPVSGAGFWRVPEERDIAARREIVRLSVPVVIERVIFHLGFLAYASVISRLGPLVMASNQALVTLESVCFLSAQGFGVATGALVGQSMGRGDTQRARRAGFLGATLAAGFLSAFGVLIWLSAPLTLHVFTPAEGSSAGLIEEGLKAAPLLALSQPFMAYAAVLSDALRGAGATRLPVGVTLLGSIGVRLPLVIWLGVDLEWGTFGVWSASTVDWILRTLCCVALFAGPWWTRARVEA
ncbi:MAG: MATE family efflux transporter [Myxococcales bacterium]|nr:MATE family efflux transporter [Myxococcales bacterium]